MNLSYYMVMVTAVMHIVPNSDYKRYIRFFTGLVLVLMLTDPVLGLLGAGDLWQNLYESPAYREQVEKMEQALQDFTGMSEDFEEESKERDQEDFAGSMGSAGTEEDAGTQIRVDEIKIGR